MPLLTVQDTAQEVNVGSVSGYLLKSPANAAHLARSIEQYRTGQLQQQDLVDADPMGSESPNP